QPLQMPVSQRVNGPFAVNSQSPCGGAHRLSEPSMSVSRPTRRALSLLCVSIALGACSSDLSAQPAAPQTTAGAARVPTAAAAPAAEPMVRGLPDFSPLVDKYGPAV